MCRSQYYYISKKDNSAIIAALDQQFSQHPVYGFRKLYVYLREKDKPWKHKKVYRVYKLLDMNKKRRGNRRLPAREKQPLEQQISINQKYIPGRGWMNIIATDPMKVLGISHQRSYQKILDTNNE